MMAKNIKAKKGFTIIEVVLVLAIAGLIFLMVFVAFPALQRSQKDTQRQNDISRLSTQITNFKTNNKNAIPGKSTKDDGDKTTVTGTSISQTPKNGTWEFFYKNYLLAGGDTFEDPDGDAYNLDIVWCGKTASAAKPSQGVSDGAECDSSVQRYNDSFANQGHTIRVVLGARCDGESAVGAAGKRNIALLYKKEGGGVICIAN